MRRVRLALQSWWTRNIVGTDLYPEYSRLDRMSGLHS